MISFLQKCYERILLGAALLALLAGAAWSWRQEQALAVARPVVTEPILHGGAYVLAKPPPPGETAVNWRKAPAQSAGGAWVYELFTPPTIYYQASTRSFAATPPDILARAGGAEPAAQLLAVRFEPYRLQLTGYFGVEGDYVAVFALPGSSGVVLARAGQRFVQLGLTLKSFEVRKVRLDHDDPWPVYDVAGWAILQDERTGAEVALDSRVRKLTDTLLAVVKLPGSRTAQELREGDSWNDGDIVYRVERIQLEPAAVVLMRMVPGESRPEICTLHPLAAAAGPDPRAPQGRNQSTSHPRNVANHGPRSQYETPPSIRALVDRAAAGRPTRSRAVLRGFR